jgi:hypothetical protein
MSNLFEFKLIKCFPHHELFNLGEQFDEISWWKFECHFFGKFVIVGFDGMEIKSYSVGVCRLGSDANFEILLRPF